MSDDLRARLTALIPEDCWVLRVPAADASCTAYVGGVIGGGGHGKGARFTEDMCCLPCRLRALLADPAPEAARERVRILTVPSEEAMFHFLTALNVSGLHPEVPCSSSNGGMSFLAGLTDPDADHVHITVTDADSGVVHCCECAHPGERANEWDPNSWKPTYPVLALATEWPDMERVADEDYIDAWWVPADLPVATGVTTEDEGCREGCKPGRMCRYVGCERAPFRDVPTPAPAPVVSAGDEGLSEEEWDLAECVLDPKLCEGRHLHKREVERILAARVAEAGARAVHDFAHWVAIARAHNGSEHRYGQSLYNECLNAVLPTWAAEYIAERSEE